MIERIVATGVAASESFGDPPGLSVFAAEEAYIARAVVKRRNEFVTTRNCARNALSQLGIAPAPILRGDKGQPLWPKPVVGSLTHCDGYRAAVAAYSLQVRSVGIDAEPHGELPSGVLDHVALPAERADLATRGNDLHWDRLLFCAKEATYKTWFPVTGRWLGFEDAHITFAQTGPGEGTFHTRILIDGSATDGGGPLAGLDGRWIVDSGLILTTIAL